MTRPTLTKPHWARLVQRIASYSGVALDDSRLRSVESAIAVRLEALGLSRIESYFPRLESSEELHALVELIVNHETQFFRTPAHYRALHEQILPELHRVRQPGIPIRAWSAGCATGEEPYSLAITGLNTLPTARGIEVHATDLSMGALARAKQGQYRGRSLVNVPPADLERFFRHQGDMYRVTPEVTSVVYFEQHNLQTSLPVWAHALDLIFCQNVTIYFGLETCRALVARFFDALSPGGYLFLGYSETLWRIFDRFETVELAGAFAYRKPITPLIERPSSRAARIPAVTPKPRPRQQLAASAQRQVTATSLIQEGRQLIAAGKLDQAFETLRHVPPDQPQYPHALALIAQIHANRGDWDLAGAEAQRAVELDTMTGEAHLLLGIVCAKQEQWAPALDHLLRAQYLDPAAPLPSFYLADVYRIQGRNELAEREYRVTLRKLESLPVTMLLDGVSVGWLRETCGRYLEQLRSSVRRR